MSVADRLRSALRMGAVLLLAATVAGAQELDQARELAEAGRLVEARSLLDEITAETSGGQEGEPRAEALGLLAGVAVRQGDMAAAATAWREIRDRYPESIFAWHAETGLALLERDPASVAVETMAPERSDEPAPSEVAETETDPAKPAAAPRAPKSPSPSALPPPPTPRLVVPRVEMSNAVLVAGDGEPPEVIEVVITQVVERLRSAGVDAEMIPVEVWWRRPYKLAEPALLETMRSAGAASLLWVEMRFGFREKFGISCHAPDGRRQWRERASGGSAFSADHRPHDEYNEELVERVLEDVVKRVGDPCLPSG